MKNEWYIIKDFDGFVQHSRILTYNSYGSTNSTDSEIDELIELTAEETKELDSILTLQETITIVKSLAKKQKNKKTKQIRFMINDDIYVNIIQSLGDRMTSNILHGLVNKGLVEMGFDEDKNDFVFWTKDHKQN